MATTKDQDDKAREQTVEDAKDKNLSMLTRKAESISKEYEEMIGNIYLSNKISTKDMKKPQRKRTTKLYLI